MADKDGKSETINWLDGYLWQGKEALKSAPAISDENQIRVPNLSEAVMKPVTSMMSLLSEAMAMFNALTEKWKWGANLFQATWLMMLKHVFWNMKN